MKKENELNTIFMNGSKTFYNATRLFPKNTRRDVTTLYAFVRTADDLVDQVPADKEGFEKFKKDYYEARKGGVVSNQVINSLVELVRRKNFREEWITEFLEAMESDLYEKEYNKIKETEKYMYGSASIVGLMMCKLMNLPDKAYGAAEKLGMAFQFINFVRDVEEDSQRGRTYFPTEDLHKFGLRKLDREESEMNRPAFEKFMRYEINRYKEWQEEAEKGFGIIPKKYLIAIGTASDLFKWTAEIIYKEPNIVFKKKVKPDTTRILWTGIKRLAMTLF